MNDFSQIPLGPFILEMHKQNGQSHKSLQIKVNEEWSCSHASPLHTDQIKGYEAFWEWARVLPTYTHIEGAETSIARPPSA